MSGLTIVFLDANVLYSRTIRDWILQLNQTSVFGMFSVVTSIDVLAEVLANYRKNYPTADGNIVNAIKRHISDCCDDVVYDYACDIDTPVKDEYDIHVHAAALAADAKILVTSDIDFLGLTQDEKDSLPFDIYTPDEFLVLADDSSPVAVKQVAKDQLIYWNGRSGNIGLEKQLRKAGCSEFAARVNLRLQQLAGQPSYAIKPASSI